VVANPPSCSFALAAEQLPVRRGSLGEGSGGETSPHRTRVWGFRQSPSGRLSRRRRRDRAIATGSARCAYKTASGRGKWLSRDPIEEDGGLNLYAFPQNDPVDLLDFLGLESATKQTPTELYCEAAKQNPNNKWLQCVCKVSGQVNALKYGLVLSAYVSALMGDERAVPAYRKAQWFNCMNRCMSKRWQAAQKKWSGEPLSNEEKKRLNPEWEKYCSGCGGASKASSKACCEQQVKGEQTGFNDCTAECGSYDTKRWGAPAGVYTKGTMNWDPQDDFNDYEKRVAYGIKLCCGEK
jgi:RHS repeat-associated protein